MGMEGNRNSLLGIIWELEYVIKLGMDKRGNESCQKPFSVSSLNSIF